MTTSPDPHTPTHDCLPDCLPTVSQTGVPALPSDCLPPAPSPTGRETVSEPATTVSPTVPQHPSQTTGLCTACGAVEVTLNNPTGTRNFSPIGEHPAYPTGYGCEVCA